jgi:hypothetical protein
VLLQVRENEDDEESPEATPTTASESEARQRPKIINIYQVDIF